MCAKRTIKKFDQVKVVMPLKFMSLGCTMVTLRSETLLYMSTPQWYVFKGTYAKFYGKSMSWHMRKRCRGPLSRT